MVTELVGHASRFEGLHYRLLQRGTAAEKDSYLLRRHAAVEQSATGGGDRVGLTAPTTEVPTLDVASDPWVSETRHCDVVFGNPRVGRVGGQ